MAVRKNVESDEYFADILAMMQEEGLISGIVTTNAWGGDRFIISELKGAKITPSGIHYLKENRRMKKVGEVLKETADTIATLANIIKPF